MNLSGELLAPTIRSKWTSMVAYTFGPFSLFPSRYILSDNGADSQLTPRLLSVLRYLIQHTNRVVTKEELIAEVWQGSFVGQENVARTVSTLRALLGDARENPKYIQTVTRVGYRFIHPVTAFYETDPSPQGVLADPPVCEDPHTVEE